MASKKAVGTIAAILIALAGGSWALSFDFSQTETNIGGDTNIDISNEGDDFCELAIVACQEDLVPEKYEDICPVIDIVCG